jgi:F420-dependent methylenetetrahydromethanopterin dehydrogenase
MKNLKITALLGIGALSLAGCSLQEVAATAADAAACKALSSTLSGISEAYDQGLVDSGIIAQLDSMVGDQVDFLLSTELAADLNELAKELSESSPAQGVSEKVLELTASISDKCSEDEIDLSN